MAAQQGGYVPQPGQPTAGHSLRRLAGDARLSQPRLQVGWPLEPPGLPALRPLPRSRDAESRSPPVVPDRSDSQACNRGGHGCTARNRISSDRMLGRLAGRRQLDAASTAGAPPTEVTPPPLPSPDGNVPDFLTVATDGTAAESSRSSALRLSDGSGSALHRAAGPTWPSPRPAVEGYEPPNGETLLPRHCIGLPRGRLGGCRAAPALRAGAAKLDFQPNAEHCLVFAHP